MFYCRARPHTTPQPLYTTDNGAYQYVWPEGSTSQFKGDKNATWEGGVHVPFIAMNQANRRLRLAYP